MEESYTAEMEYEMACNKKNSNEESVHLAKKTSTKNGEKGDGTGMTSAPRCEEGGDGEPKVVGRKGAEESLTRGKRTKDGEDGDGIYMTAPSGEEVARDAKPKAERHRLLFPGECQLSYQQKVLWVMKLCRERRSFQPLMKEGRYKPYITFGTAEAVQHLTTEGFNGVVLKLPPQDQERTNKVLIFRYPVFLDPDYLLDDPNIVWARWNKVRGEQKSQVIALMRGDIPDTIFVTGIGSGPLNATARSSPCA